MNFTSRVVGTNKKITKNNTVQSQHKKIINKNIKLYRGT